MIFPRKTAAAVFAALAVFSFAAIASAADPVKLIVPIGGITRIGDGGAGPDEYVKTFYQWSIGLAAILAMAQLVVGGVQYVLAAGSVSSKESANERIRSSLTGLVILISIVTILTTINPNLAKLTPASVTPPLPGSIDFSALDAATNREISTLRNATSTRAAYDANQRIAERAANNVTVFRDALELMKAEIGQFVARDCIWGVCNDDLQEVVGDAGQDIDDDDMPLAKLQSLVAQRRIVVDGQADGFADFYQYAKLAADEYKVAAQPNREVNKRMGDGYRDAVRAAINFAMFTMTPEDQARTVLLISTVQPIEVRNIMLGK